MNLFEFDYDLTFAVFFLNAQNRVYARYGGRDGRDADSRNSLEGLAYTMRSVLAMHERSEPRFAPRTDPQEKYSWNVTGWYGGGCLHCHQVKEAINEKLVRDGAWHRDRIWRFPLPENVGVRLELDRGNVVAEVRAGTPAERVGLRAGDVLQTLGAVPIHSFADAQFALDKAPESGTLGLTWLRGPELLGATLELAAGWKKTDISWRASLRWQFVPSLPLYGDDLTADEREALGLSAEQLAFRQNDRLQARARQAGFQSDDVIVGLDDKQLDMGVDEFRDYVRRQYLIGDTITLTLIRDGRVLKIPLKL